MASNYSKQIMSYYNNKKKKDEEEPKQKNNYSKQIMSYYDENGNHKEKVKLPMPQTNEPNRQELQNAINSIGKSGINTTKKVANNLVDEGKKLGMELLVNANDFKHSNTQQKLEKIGKTAVNIPLNLVRGGGKAVEDFYDFSLNASSNIDSSLQKIVGNITEEQAKKQRQQAQNIIKEDLTQKTFDLVGLDENRLQQLEKNSYVKRDNILGQAIESVGRMLPQVAIGRTVGFTPNMSFGQNLIASVPGDIAMGTTSYGSALEKAYQNGATTSEANRFAALSAATEVLTEKIDGGIPGTKGKGALDRLLGDADAPRTIAQFMKKYVKSGLGEIAEEELSELLEPIWEQFTYDYNSEKDVLGNLKEATKKYSLDNFINTALSTLISTGILETPNMINDLNNIKQNSKIQDTNQKLEELNNQLQQTSDPQERQKIYDEAEKVYQKSVKEENNTNTQPIQETSQEQAKNSQLEDNTTQEMQNNENIVENKKEDTNNVSFSYDENAKRYEDLTKTNNIEYFTKDDGSIRINMLDSNNNLVNQMDLISKDYAIKQLGEDLGNYIYQNSNDEFKNIRLGNDINNLGTETDYFMTHRPTETGLTGDNITNQDVETPIPKDALEHPEYYWNMQDKSVKESIDVLRKIQNNPDAEITIYRATPGDKINAGDWITLSKEYAKEHNESQFDGKANILEMKVKAKDIQFAGDEINEFGYFPKEENKNIIGLNEEQFEKSVKENLLTKEQHNKVVDNYENAKNNIDRNTLLETAKDLKITHKNKSSVYENSDLQNKSGNNKNPKIINIDGVFTGNDFYSLTKTIREKALSLFTNNKDGYTNFVNKDTNTNAEIGKSGIKKTFNNNSSESKLNTYDKLKEICEEGIYYETTINDDDPNILYHHFLTPVKAYDTNGNAFVRFVIKEFTQQKDVNNKFYYHQFEYLDNKKEITLPGSQNRELQAFELISNKDNTTKQQESQIKLPSSKQEVKLPTAQERIQDNPITISNMTEQDANTTPKLPTYNVEKGTENSHFTNNIQEKSDFLNEESKQRILQEEGANFYKGISNEETLDKAYNKLQEGGQQETYQWFNKDSKKATATDVAEGWILMKQYQDIGDYDSMVQVAKKMREIGTTAGQTVQAFNIMERLTPEGMVKYAQSELSEAFDQMQKNKTQKWINENREKFDLKPEEVQFIVDNMKEVQNMEDGYEKRVKLAEIQKLLTDKLPIEKGRGIKSWMRISMLFNPKTQVRNVAGNTIIMPINSYSDLFSTYADKLISKKTGKRTTGLPNIKAQLKGMKEGAIQATNDYRKGINTRDMEGNRFEVGEGKSFSEKTIIGKGLNRTDALLNYVMDAGDRIFSQAAFENSLQNQMILNNTTEITQEMIDIARQESLSRTWNDNNNYTKFVLNIRKGLNKISLGGYGLGDVLIPFAKTPANLTKAIVDYSPAGMLKAINEGNQLRKDIGKGTNTLQQQHQFVQNLGKAMAGSSLYILAYALAKAGIITGSGDDDKDVANFIKNTMGVNNYSIKIGNKSFTYDWAQPVSAPFSIMSDFVKNQKEGQTLIQNFSNILNAGFDTLLEQSFMSSINDVLSGNGTFTEKLEKQILALPSRAVPTFVKQIADMTDGTQRQTYVYNNPLQTAINSVKVKIPGVSKTLPPAVDTFGREIKKYGGNNNPFNVFFNPANVNSENLNENASEIYRLYQKTGRKDIMPQVSKYYDGSGENKEIYTNEQRVEMQKVSGKIVNKQMTKLLNNKSYKYLNDNEKAEIVANVVQFAGYVSRKEVLGEDDDIAQNYSVAYQYSKVADVSNYYLMKNATKNLEADKDQYGKTISGSKKDKIINTVKDLDIPMVQKAMYIRKEYSSFKDYDDEIINYVKNKNISVSEKTEVLQKFGFTVKDGKVYK